MTWTFPSAPRLRSLAVHAVVVTGVVASVATSAPENGITGVTDSETLVLNADEPSVTFTAAAHLVLDAEGTVQSGDIGLNVQPDGDATGSLAFSLDSATQSATGDIVDTQAQGATRIAIEAFGNCTGECSEELTLTFERTDDALDGDLSFIWSLDGFASPDTDTSGAIEFTVD